MQWFEDAATATIGIVRAQRTSDCLTKHGISWGKEIFKSITYPKVRPQFLDTENEEYRAEDKAVKKSTRKDQRNLAEQKKALALEVAKRGDVRDVYRIIN